MVSFFGAPSLPAIALATLSLTFEATGTPSLEVVLALPEKLGGCAVGDLDPSKDGVEIAAVSEGGEAYVAYRRNESWRSRRVLHTPGEMIQCAIGDGDRDRPGLELLMVGMTEGPEMDAGPGAAYLVALEGERWVSERIFESSALLHGVCANQGSVFVTGYDKRLTRVWKGESGWDSELVGELPGAGKSVIAARQGIVVACTDGSVVHFQEAGEGWHRTLLDQRSAGRARLASYGNRILVADDDGVLSLLEGDERIEVFEDVTRLRGAGLADFDITTPGLELATAGYSHRVTVLACPAGMWPDRSRAEAPEAISISRPFVDSERIHHLATGDLDGDGDAEIVVCGYSGLLVAIDF